MAACGPGALNGGRDVIGREGDGRGGPGGGGCGAHHPAGRWRDALESHGFKVDRRMREGRSPSGRPRFAGFGVSCAAGGRLHPLVSRRVQRWIESRCDLEQGAPSGPIGECLGWKSDDAGRAADGMDDG